MMLAYHNDANLRDATVAEVQKHMDADALVQGYGYWKDGKGCAVGCLLKSSNHAEYETRFGIPIALARLEDTIFENLPADAARKWPMRFMLAPRPGADLALVQWKFLAFVVGEALARPEAASVRAACQPALDIVEAKARGEAVSAESAASAASAARSAARSAAWSAESAASAASAAWSAERRAARSAERRAAWVRYADNLIELIEAAPLAAQENPHVD
jgi:hypothetical protein